MPTKLRVLIIEDEVLIAEDLRDCLETLNYEVAAIAYSKEDALFKIEASNFDLALIDINLNGELAGLELASLLKDHAQKPFFFITSYAHQAIVEQAKEREPLGYLVKPFTERDLYTTLEIGLLNYSKIEKHSTWEMDSLNDKLQYKLTNKEFEILKDLYVGLNNQELCDKHFVSINTIKTHLKSIYKKFETKTRLQTVSKARKLLDHS